MWLRLAAMSALSIAPCLTTAQQHPNLTLNDAFAHVAEAHPDLRLFGPRQDVLRAASAQAALRPPLRAAAELENALGTGDARDLHSAELTLNLASVFERGGKLDARRTLAERRIDALAVEREIRRLDLLG